MQAAQTRRAIRQSREQDSEPDIQLASSSGVPIRGRSSTRSTSSSRSRSRRYTPYSRARSTAKDIVVQRLKQQAEEDKAQAELLEARIRHFKAQRELEELKKEK